MVLKTILETSGKITFTFRENASHTILEIKNSMNCILHKKILKIV